MILHTRSSFFITTFVLYASAIIFATLALNAYFAQTWDAQTFIQAARQLLDGNPFDLYAQSRAAQTWPYAYPPLHAIVVALALVIGDATHILPDFIWARVPALIADIGVAYALYRVVLKKSNDGALARIGFLAGLFNPVTFYNTAVQAHFESEWIFFVLLAFIAFESGRGIFLPTIFLAIAVLFKQTAIVYAMMMWLTMSLRGAERSEATKQSANCGLRIADFGKNIAASSLLPTIFSFFVFLFIALAICSPFILYSNDFVFMNLTYVEQVPVQTVSWLVGVLGLTRAAPDALTSDFFLLRYSTWITLAAAAIISFIAARRGWSLWQTGIVVTLAFFLLSRKVMGYYYVMLTPFMLAEFLPRRRFDLILFAIIAAAFIHLAPYDAAWTEPAHWWIYALIGTAASAVWVWLFAQVARANTESTNEMPKTKSSPRSLIIISLGLFSAALLAALFQPLIANNGSPIRAPILAPGLEIIAWRAFGALIALTLIALAIFTRATRAWGTLSRRALIAPLIFLLVTFAVYTLTKETTAIVEVILKGLGL